MISCDGGSIATELLKAKKLQLRTCWFKQLSR
jgi:hypothetical protein